MAVSMRLTRVGGKKDPVWRVVVADRRSPRDGRFIETVGRYNAQTDPSTIVLDEERIRHWLDRVEAIILSMTPYERNHPEAIKGSRRLRIAKGSGTNVQQVNQLIKQFDQMRKMMRGIQQGKMPDIAALMRQR